MNLYSLLAGNSLSCYAGDFLGLYRAEVRAYNRAQWEAFLVSLCQPWVSVFVYVVSSRVPRWREIRQPCWRAGRWKSLT